MPALRLKPLTLSALQLNPLTLKPIGSDDGGGEFFPNGFTNSGFWYDDGDGTGA